MNPLPSLDPADIDYVVNTTAELWTELRGQRLIITGGTGFFGCWLLETFAWANRKLDLGASVTVLTRNPDAFMTVELPESIQRTAAWCSGSQEATAK